MPASSRGGRALQAHRHGVTRQVTPEAEAVIFLLGERVVERCAILAAVGARQQPRRLPLGALPRPSFSVFLDTRVVDLFLLSRFIV